MQFYTKMLVLCKNVQWLCTAFTKFQFLSLASERLHALPVTNLFICIFPCSPTKACIRLNVTKDWWVEEVGVQPESWHSYITPCSALLNPGIIRVRIWKGVTQKRHLSGCYSGCKLRSSVLDSVAVVCALGFTAPAVQLTLFFDSLL